MQARTPPAHAHLAALVKASSTLAALPTSAAPEAIFAALYDQVAALLDVRDFVVSLYDRETERIHCGYVVADGAPWPTEDLPPLKLGAGPTSRVIRTGQPVIRPDIRAGDTSWVRKEVGSGPPVRSMLLAPMTRGGQVVGVVQAQSPLVDAFNADDAAALSVLANQAAAALEAARQRRHAEQAAARARLLDDTGRLLSESLDLTAVLTTLAEQVSAVMGGGCAVYLLSADGLRYEERMVRYRDPKLAALTRGRLSQAPPSVRDSFVGRTILRGEPVFIDDAAQAPLEPDLAAAVAAMDVRQACFAPLRRSGHLLGSLLVLGTAAYPLARQDLPLAVAVAERATGAIENAVLHLQVSDQQRFLAHLIENAPIGIAVVRGPEHVYEVANETYRQFKGGSDLIGRRYEDITNMPDAGWPIIGKGRLDHVRAGGEPIHLSDLRIQRPDGSSRFVAIDLSPLPADRSGPSGVLILMRETTDRVLAADRLEQLARQSEAHAAELEAIIAGMTEGVLVTAADGTVRLLNPAGRRMFGDAWLRPSVPAWEAVTRLGIRYPDGRPVEPAESRALWTTTHPRTGVEFIIRTPGGEDRLISAGVAPLPGAGPGTPGVGAVAVFEDITDRRALEEAREEFLAQASHELRTPLTAMLGFLQMAERRLARDATAPGIVKDSVTAAVAQAGRLRELVNDLLDASRIRQGRIELRRQPVDLVQLVSAFVCERRETVADQESGHVLHLEAPPSPLIGSWDGDRLRQVVVNLVDNAIKYSPSGGNVWVTVRQDGPSVLFSVRDQGIGIPESEMSKLFRPFGRAEHQAARSIPGFGMGLYICRDIVERHGGRIEVASTPGAGTTFTVIIPMQ